MGGAQGQGAVSGAEAGAGAGSALGPWGAAAGGVIGGAMGYFGADKSNPQAQQEQAYRQDLANREAFQKQQQGLYGPLEQSLVQQASSTQPLFYGQMSGAINQNFDQAQRNAASQMAARGMSGSGLQGAGIQGMEMGRAGALSQAFNQGLQARQALGLNVLSRYQPLMNQMNTQSAYGQLGGMYGQQAMLQNQAQREMWQMGGQALQNGVQSYMNQKEMVETPPAPKMPMLPSAGMLSPAQGSYNPSVANPMSVTGTPPSMNQTPMIDNPIWYNYLMNKGSQSNGTTN